MRVTNSMITANTKANININKESADRLNTMASSGQKIIRPSDDPVVAIRALRLNTSIDELTQYHGKNIPDADAWFTDTETALSQADEVLSDIREKLNQASSEENVTSNVKDILEELKQLRDQFYALGNTDSAGRTVFTGYRTNEMLTFTKADSTEYEIVENFTYRDIETKDYVYGTKDINIAGGNLAPYAAYTEVNVENKQYSRIRLSYDDIEGIYAGSDSNDYTTKNTTCSVIVTKPDGTTTAYAPEVVSIAGKSQEDIDAIYMGADGNGITAPVIIKETGELILPKDINDSIINGTASLSVTYNKSSWEKGDLHPEHYFRCKTIPDANDPTTYMYNPDDATGKKYAVEYNYNRVNAAGESVVFGGTITGFKEQEINYEIAYNQTIGINTHANATFNHDIGRDIDELINITQALYTAETDKADIEKALNAEDDETKKAAYQTLLDAVEKERVLTREKMHKMYENAITSFKNYSDAFNNEISRLGALTSRLEMTKNRVKDQQDNVKKIADQNINADLAETAIDYSNATLALEAAQMAAAKIAKQTLLNYI